MAGLFDKIKKDVTKGIEEGIAVFKEGANVVSGKVGELTAEGKRQYKMFALKTKIQTQMTELGGRVYDLLDGKKSPTVDSKIKAVFIRIKNLEAQLAKLEGGKAAKAAAPKKPARKAKAAAKKSAPAPSKKPAAKTAKKTAAQK